MPERIILDTGPLVAFIDQGEGSLHQWSVDQSSRLSPPFFTCEAVLAEAFHLLRNVHGGHEKLNELLNTRRVEIPFQYRDHRVRIQELMTTYQNVPMDFADACLVALYEQLDDAHVFTIDSDFRIYRAHRNKQIRALLPPSR